jgi:uncharacterized protein YwqG
MKYFIPRLETRKNLETSINFKEKLGGLPFGLPIEMYPICKECGNLMTFLAQFIHEKDRLDLGREGRILFIFQCDSEEICESWNADSGANACFITELEILTGKEINPSELNTPSARENLIEGWIEHNDGVSDEESGFFFDTQKYDEIDFNQFVKLLDKTKSYTKLGSVPYWIQYPEPPAGNWRFVGQLDSNNGFQFGDMGIGYIFIEKTENPEKLPKGKFLWQCG